MEEIKKKHGLLEEEAYSLCKRTNKRKNISIKGLMTILPNKIKKTEQKKLYNKMKKMQKKISKTINKECQNLSMGMSQDYEIASKSGSTQIRIGTFLYGER